MLGLPPHDDLGPPVLLKRLGNMLEATLARARLDSAGIPSFIAGPDAFAADQAGLVGLFVPERYLAEALDVLDGPPVDDVASFDSPDDWPVDPGRRLAFRAIVASVAGWTILFMTLVGLLLAVPTFGYAIALAIRAVQRSTTRDRGLRLQVAAALVLSALGLAMATCLGLLLLLTR